MSKRPPKPQDYPWVIPYFTVKDADAAIAFYEKAFGFEKHMAMPGPDGKTGHAEMRYRDSMIMLGPARPHGEWPHKPPVLSKVLAPVTLYIYCDDVDALFARATSAGAKTIRPLENQFYGDRTCVVEDPDGYWWHFATNVADFDPNNVPK